MNARRRKYSAAARRVCHAAVKIIALLLCPLFFALNAYGELADKDKPINVESDRLAIDEKKQESSFEGNVVVTQGTLVIHSNKMTITQDANGFQFGTAFGNPAQFKQKRDGLDEYIEAFADRIEYDTKSAKIQFFANAHIKRGNDTLNGAYISYDTVSEYFQVSGKSRAGKPTSGRARALIQPKNKVSATTKIH